jgi:hypothetical protein
MFLGMNRLENGWLVIKKMFAKVAGGVKKIHVDGDAFLQQYNKVDAKMSDSIVDLVQQKNPHTPLLCRLKLLQDYGEKH